VRVPLWTIPALLLAALTLTSSFACGGDSKEEEPSGALVFPTATLPSTLPDPIIVSGTPRPQGGSDRYVVQEGDSPASIADQFGVSLDELLSVNNITDPTDLHVGDELIIPSGDSTPEPQDEPTAAPTTAPQEEEPTAQPTSGSTGGTTYTVQENDNPASIAAQFGITAEELMEANGITDPTSLLVGQVLTIPGQ
jgi:LysM repeat protein